jgi:hypothetical protein
MNNTIITSVSALVFLVIGLLIGKSNKQIEIQTVVKTNIVEKPVENVVEKIVEKPVKEYVDKYITNVVEKIVEAEIPEKYQFALEIQNRMLNASYLRYDKLPKGITDLKINVFIDKKYESQIDSKQILEMLELEARKIGIKINNESKYSLSYEIDIMPLNDDSQFAYADTLAISRESYLFATPENTYRISPLFWKQESIGVLGKSKFNTSTLIGPVSRKMTAFCNRILETREK